MIIKEIQKYLSECKYKNNGFKEISCNLYPKYIESDDKALLKLIKRLLIIYKRSHTKLLCKMFHKWEIISYKIKFNINNELKKELEEPQLEKNPKVFSMIREENNNVKKQIKMTNKLNKNEKNNDNYFIKNKTFEELNINPKIINDDESIEIQELMKENNSKDLISYGKINENDDIINRYDKPENIENNGSNNLDLVLNKSKSVNKFKNINFKVEKPKRWEYSYYIKEKNEDNSMKNKNKKKLMSNQERQKLFNNLYNDCQKRQEKFKQMKMEKEAQFNTLYTFTPKIFQNKLNEKYMKNMVDSKFYSKNNINNTDNNIINNTISSLNIGNNKEKIEENKEEIQLNFISRLSEYEKIKKQNLEKIRNEVYTNYDMNQKKIRKSYDKILPNHLMDNTENFLELKQKNIERIKQNMDMEQGITFQPKTNKNFNNKIKNNIIERTNEFMKEKQEKLEKYSHIKEKECTFKPKINNIETSNRKENSKQSNISFKTEQNSSDVSKRLFDYQKKYKENLEDIRSKYKESYSFNPIISKNTRSILNNRQKLKEKFEGNTDSQNTNYELIKKQIKLGELEELSRKLEEIKNENLETDEKNSNKKIKVNNYSNKIKERKDINNNDDQKSKKIMELANNLINNKNNKLIKQEKESDKNENTNDFIILMNKKPKTISKQSNFVYDFDKSKENKQIMDFNYYDNLL